MKHRSKHDLYEASRHDFRVFLWLAFGTLNPGKNLSVGKYLLALLWHLEQVRKGKIKRLIINMPPRCLKSISTSVVFPLWLWTKDPSSKFLCASYGQELSEELAQFARTIIESEWFQLTFSEVVLNPKKNEVANYQTTRNGIRRSTSIGGPGTGFGGDFLIVDDPHKAADAYNPKKLESDFDWFKSTLLSRRNDPREGRIVVVQQRLAHNDTSGMLERAGGWTVLNLPAIAEEYQCIQIGEDEFWERHPGDLLDEDRLGWDVLDEIKALMGEDDFNAQYQQSPSASAGACIDASWIRYEDISALKILMIRSFKVGIRLLRQRKIEVILFVQHGW